MQHRSKAHGNWRLRTDYLQPVHSHDIERKKLKDEDKIKRKDYKKWTATDEDYLTSLANENITIANTDFGKEQEAVKKRKEEQSLKDEGSNYP